MNKILLVDDDKELTSLLKELLDMEGFNVLVAHDGEQALSLLDDSIDLLLLDVMMPKKNGIDTLKELRQQIEQGELGAGQFQRNAVEAGFLTPRIEAEGIHFQRW